MKDDLIKIFENFGTHTQLKKFNEESYELIEAIVNYEEKYCACDCNDNYVQREYNHIIEEMADCFIMLGQFKAYYDIDYEDIMKVMDEKVKRTLKRIEEGYYKNGEGK